METIDVSVRYASNAKISTITANLTQDAHADTKVLVSGESVTLTAPNPGQARLSIKGPAKGPKTDDGVVNLLRGQRINGQKDQTAPDTSMMGQLTFASTNS